MEPIRRIYQDSLKRQEESITQSTDGLCEFARLWPVPHTMGRSVAANCRQNDAIAAVRSACDLLIDSHGQLRRNGETTQPHG